MAASKTHLFRPGTTTPFCGNTRWEQGTANPAAFRKMDPVCLTCQKRLPPLPVNQSRYMPDDVLLLSLGLILALHRNNRRRLVSEVKDLMKRVPIERRENLRRIIRYKRPEHIIEKLLLLQD